MSSANDLSLSASHEKVEYCDTAEFCTDREMLHFGADSGSKDLYTSISREILRRLDIASRQHN